MKKFVFTAVLFFSLVSFGQSSNDKVVYLDSLGLETDSISFKTKKVIEDFNLEKNIYNVKEYSSQNILLVSKQIKSKKFQTLDGEYIEFHTNGNIKKKFKYENQKQVGEVKTWYRNGNLEFEGNYNLVDKKTELFIKSFWDENGVQKVINGEGIFVETEIGIKNDTLKITGPIVKGQKDGVWKNLKDGYPNIEDSYEKGKFISGKTKHTENEIYSYNEVTTHAQPNEGIQSFRKKMATNLKFPVSNSLNLNTIVGFDVSFNGSIENIKILKETRQDVSESVINFMKAESNWIPSKYRGKSKKSFYKLPISIQIN